MELTKNQKRPVSKAFFSRRVAGMCALDLGMAFGESQNFHFQPGTNTPWRRGKGGPEGSTSPGWGASRPCVRAETLARRSALAPLTSSPAGSGCRLPHTPDQLNRSHLSRVTKGFLKLESGPSSCQYQTTLSQHKQAPPIGSKQASFFQPGGRGVPSAIYKVPAQNRQPLDPSAS